METVSIKEQIINDLDILEQTGMLLVLWQLVALMKQQIKYSHAEINPILKHAGRMLKEDAHQISNIVSQEFNTVEGEW